MGERIQSINAVGILVHDYDEAIAFFTEKLNFDLLANEAHDNGIRWVLLHPPGLSNAGIMLNLAQSKLDEMVVGKQAGDQVLFVLQTNDFWRDYKSMQSKGVNFIETPRDEEYGTVAIFEDLYGNKWDLLQVKDEE
ncbi:VOC family protein [Marisediminitalea sp.]|jgi:catechol 2,3-dioxygenase-like lactoylglutathione lyase family enzyme|uniref:VOC family protein n=1 Tax=Marisediminitalea sp. TaxID=2662268 RepID=UPI003510F352